MGEHSKIEWTDHTASPWYGCEKVAEGCKNCYAAAMSRRNPAVLGEWGPDGTRPKSKSFFRNLELWNAQAEKAGKPVSVFPSLCDPFEDRADVEEVRKEMFAAADRLPWIRLLLLTKRPQFIWDMWPWEDAPIGAHDWRAPRHNIWIGTSIACRKDLCNIRTLRMCRELSPVLFLSIEPLIEDLGTLDLRGMDWVIVGGESGPNARPMHPSWVRAIRDQCQAAGVPFLFKQWGEWYPVKQSSCAPGYLAPNINRASEWTRDDLGAPEFAKVGKKAAGRLLDGREWNEFPEVKQ